MGSHGAPSLARICAQQVTFHNRRDRADLLRRQVETAHGCRAIHRAGDGAPPVLMEPSCSALLSYHHSNCLQTVAKCTLLQQRHRGPTRHNDGNSVHTAASADHSLAEQACQAAAAAAAATPAIPGRSICAALLCCVQLLLRCHRHGQGAVAAASSVGCCCFTLLHVPSHGQQAHTSDG